jgi:hypothetical protein
MHFSGLFAAAMCARAQCRKASLCLSHPQISFVGGECIATLV